jgi:hypothetical protein
MFVVFEISPYQSSLYEAPIEVSPASQLEKSEYIYEEEEEESKF